MKIFFCFVILFAIGHCFDDSVPYGYGREFVSEGVYQYDGRYEDNYRDFGNSSEPIIYPCAVHDTNCIRRFFAQNSQCSPVEGPTPDPYILKLLYVDIPHANLTLILNNAPVQGLHNWRIQEFYINKATNRLVFEVIFEKIVLTSQRTMLRFYRKGKEPIDVTDFATIEYENVSLTLTIPDLKDIHLSRGHVYAFLPELLYKFVLGPGLLNTKDPDASLALVELTTNQAVSAREIFATEGPVFLSIFFQSTICNFGYH